MKKYYGRISELLEGNRFHNLCDDLNFLLGEHLGDIIEQEVEATTKPLNEEIDDLMVSLDNRKEEVEKLEFRIKEFEEMLRDAEERKEQWKNKYEEAIEELDKANAILNRVKDFTSVIQDIKDAVEQ